DRGFPRRTRIRIMNFMTLRRTLRAVLSSVNDTFPELHTDPAYEADEILRIRSGLDRAAMLLRSSDEVPEETVQKTLSDAERRRTGEPLAYILGRTPFFGCDYEIAPGCLIPRSDTEILVEEAISRLPEGCVLWDLCTGSGCVPCAVLLNRPDVPAAYGAELYDIPLALAERNGKNLGLENRFFPVRCDVLKGELPAAGKRPAAGTRPAVITSNPPYIPAPVCKTLDAQVKCEPITALDGGEDGLIFYRAILAHYKEILAPGGCFLFEIGYDQGDALRALAAEHGFTCEIRRDYADLDRVAILYRMGEMP
ncbi:MAG: peptide chain release factor N(5)-glutamine methyltransferase, partial [Clostridia bacterium]|nr:peptide chain release factor N(5)-glutamine methyltransferase [Clostridia bacterium]